MDSLSGWNESDLRRKLTVNDNGHATPQNVRRATGSPSPFDIGLSGGTTHRLRSGDAAGGCWWRLFWRWCFRPLPFRRFKFRQHGRDAGGPLSDAVCAMRLCL